MMLISKLGIGAGLIFTLSSIARYYWFIPDLDRLVAYTAIGVLCILFFFNMDMTRQNKLSLIEYRNWIRDNFERFRPDGTIPVQAPQPQFPPQPVPVAPPQLPSVIRVPVPQQPQVPHHQPPQYSPLSKQVVKK